MLVELAPANKDLQQKLTNAIGALTVISDIMKASPSAFMVEPNQLVAVLDSLCDQIVTATGVGTFLGMNIPGAMDEVNRSNYSKFVDGQPIFDENRKVKKGPKYTKPVLIPFV